MCIAILYVEIQDAYRGHSPLEHVSMYISRKHRKIKLVGI